MILTEEIENSLKNEAEIDDLLKQIHIIKRFGKL